MLKCVLYNVTAETTRDGFRLMHYAKVIKTWPIGKQKSEHAYNHLVPLLIAAAIFCTSLTHQTYVFDGEGERRLYKQEKLQPICNHGN